MNKKLIEFGVVTASILLMGAFGALYSLLFAGAAGSIAVGVNPAYSFGLVGSYVCPSGSTLQYTPAGPDAGSRIACVSPGGVRQVPFDQAMFALNRLLFIICFIPTFIPGVILMWLTIHRLTERAFVFAEEPVETDED